MRFWTARHALLIVQFVDDSFLFQSSPAGLAAANRGLSQFCTRWRHRFQGGRKKPVVMAVGADWRAGGAAFGSVDGESPAPADSLDMLGVPVDDGLTFHVLLAKVCARLRDGMQKLVASLEQRGFGMPYQAAQIPTRVEAAAFFGAELLASYGPGWRVAVTRLNSVQYDAAKVLLGVGKGTAFGEGGHARALAETRMLTRWGAKLLQRIALARARLLALPRSNPVAAAVLGSRAVTGATWLEHAAEVVTHLQVQGDFCADRLGEVERACPVARKRAARQWKHTALLPAVRAQE